jgi:hypothetical protein
VSAQEIVYSDHEEIDLTGDGVAESVRVAAIGPAYQDLKVVLVVTDSTGAVLLRDQWNSASYFQYEPLEGKADSTIQRIVRGHFEDVLGGSAFSTKEMVDTEAIEWDLRATQWREEHHWPPFERLPRSAYRDIGVPIEDSSEAVRLADELRGKRSIRYYAGGEAFQTYTWSDSLHRFVLVFSCC